MKRLLLTVALLLVVAVTTAQVTTSTIRGSVTVNDNPLSGATIVALHTPSGTNYGTTSNSDGPDVDLLIRTGGELRVSNFLLWQISYAELYVTDLYWPDFDDAALLDAINAYNRRDRRLGGLSS